MVRETIRLQAEVNGTGFSYCSKTPRILEQGREVWGVIARARFRYWPLPQIYWIMAQRLPSASWPAL